MRLTTLIDNKQSQKQLKCEHGLSFLLQTDELSILFDTGQSDKFLSNAQKLGIDLSTVDYVVLSHGHYDHTGGLPAFLNHNKKAKVIIHKKALKERFSSSTQMVKPNGITWVSELSQFANRVMFIENDVALTDSLFLLTNIQPKIGFEIVNERLVVKHGNSYTPDCFDDEMILVAKRQQNPIVLCGCAHTGIVNILHEIKQRKGFDTFDLVAGGLHLNGNKHEQVQFVIDGLAPFNIKQWALNHCTGDVAFNSFLKAFPEQVMYCGSGKEILI
ncbi:MBL fold metallo-hydrolase [Carboxylicivirga marina]|uniref:MBL fold metallo-hydrolase n=1 Tax=Carboxylicivirga marina TaxID=2800988 RepID=A0ABS1HJT3_9BACT|nr:MBL fold metallo-hydrolase [Carboxylicivirga marina]MBK3517414.1 MBL fold metallo-hydrolase [Carboxylicivirga marina]